MVVLDNVVIFTKFFFEFIISTGIAFVFFAVLVANIVLMVAECREVRKEESEKEKEKENNEDEKNIKTEKKE